MSHYDRTFTIGEGIEACTFAGIDPNELAAKIHEVLLRAGYRVLSSESDITVYETGNKFLRLLLGGLSGYHKTGITMRIDANGEVVVTIRDLLGGQRKISREHRALIAKFQEL